MCRRFSFGCDFWGGSGIGHGSPFLRRFIDVGTAAATIQLAAHSLGIGAGPVTSFSKAAVGTLLRLPDGLEPDLIVCLGHPAAGGPAPIRRGRAITWRDLTTFVP